MPKKLTSMELPKKSKKELKKDGGNSIPDQQKYPWGLTLNLDTNSIKKLGINMSEYELEGKVYIMAEAEIESMSVEERKGKKKDRSMRLQITDMSIKNGNDAQSAFDEED